MADREHVPHCTLCEAPAKYDVGSSPSCGRHLSYLVGWEARASGGTVSVSVRPKEKS